MSRVIKLKSIILAATLVLLLSAGIGQASVIVGTNNDANCYPFSCAASDGEKVYQEIYSSSAFSSPLTFNAVSFFQAIPGLMDSASYKVSFSTTSKAISGLDSNYVNNIGPDSAVFGTYTLGGTMPNILTLQGTPFSYKPMDGNLLMTVEIFGLTQSNGYQSFFQADSSGSVLSRLYDGDSTGTDAYGLVTRFDTSASVPEPATMLLLGAGLAGMGLLRKKIRN